MKPSADATTRFSNRVADYVRSRPRYPAGVLEILRTEIGLTADMVVADVGSGTGFSAELFLQNGHTVYGVEPNVDMRVAAEKLLASYATFQSVNGTAEATTLLASSIDLVVAGQAFHWFDDVKARVEFLRILRGPRFAVLLWNTIDESASAFMRSYVDLLRRFGTDYNDVIHTNVRPEDLHAFYGGAYVLRTMPNEQLFDHAGLRARMLSSSYIPATGHANHEPMLRELERIFAANEQGGTIRFLYRTELYCGRMVAGTA